MVRSRGWWRFVVEKNAAGGAIEIVELPGTKCPEEGDEPDKAECESDRDEQQQAIHDLLRARRNALPTTASDEPDIASAAKSGVTNPSIASGTATRL